MLAFLIVGLGPAALLTYLAFERAQDAVRTEIEQNITVQAASLSTEINRILFERLENSATWSRLDVMEDIRINDVDKRLSLFLSELKTGYGPVYQELYCTDIQGVKVASSNATLIGQHAADPIGWKSPMFPGTELSMGPSPRGPNASPTLSIRTHIPVALGDRSPGELTLLFDWQEIQSLLDQAASNGRSVAVLDQAGRVIVASEQLHSKDVMMTSALADWIPKDQSNASSIRQGSPVAQGEVILGIAQSRDYLGFEGFGWSTLVIEPLNTALAPIRRMALVFLGLLLLVAALTVMVALWATKTIGQPITSLTAFTRRFMHKQELVDVPRASGEVGELTSSFVRMVEEIARSRQKLIQSSKLAALGEMAAILAHEIRTPLGIVRSSVQLLNREPALSEDSRELLGFVESETERLNRLISTLLDSSRPRPPVIVPVDVHAVIKNCASMLAAQAAKKHIQIEDLLAPGSIVVQSDAEQLTQVILNLLLNAIQILPAGGHVAIASTVEVESVSIEIADDGPGIAVDDRDRIFEAFFFRREGGVGLGLAVVKQIVDAHGGEIEVGRSQLGGALFTIRLPRTSAKDL